MAFDGITTYALKTELSALILSARIEKVYQPEKDEVHLLLHGEFGKSRLVLCANSNCPRVHLTDKSKQNPENAPMFCMLLRKHIQSGKIIDISTNGMDRILKITVEKTGELYDIEKKQLIIEIMGKHSNIILVGKDNKIIDSIKHIDLTISSVRQILPGLFYEPAPSQNKICPLTYDGDFGEFSPDLAVGKIDKFILNTFEGISPVIAREIVYRAYKDTSVTFEEIKSTDALKTELFRFFDIIKSGKFSPCVIFDSSSKKAMDFSPIEIHQYENMATITPCESVSCALNEFYQEKDNAERLTQKKANLFKVLKNHLDRCNKKLSIQHNNLKSAENMDKYKIYGDLLLANLYAISEHAKEIEVTNFYDENSPVVKIPLKDGITPSQNVQKYYDKYRKAKSTKLNTEIQLRLNLEEIEYLEAAMEGLTLADSIEEISEIREELASEGYIKKDKAKNKKKKTAEISAPQSFKSSDGFVILVGKNNRQNDNLTLKIAHNKDLWFHTKNIPGSHTVIKTEGQPVPDTTLTEAATLAAFFSKAKNSVNVAVDYTAVKNVKKPSGAKPGMVIYENYKTIYVSPTDEILKLKNL